MDQSVLRAAEAEWVRAAAEQGVALDTAQRILAVPARCRAAAAAGQETIMLLMVQGAVVVVGMPWNA
jgi:hypothetical protein